jgi:hypothetical protein
VNPADLAGGLWEALIPTAFGFLLAIPTFAAYNYFVTRVARFVHEMEATSSEFLDLMDRRNEGDAGINASEHQAIPPALMLDDDQFFRKKAVTGS